MNKASQGPWDGLFHNKTDDFCNREGVVRVSGNGLGFRFTELSLLFQDTDSAHYCMGSSSNISKGNVKYLGLLAHNVHHVLKPHSISSLWGVVGLPDEGFREGGGRRYWGYCLSSVWWSGRDSEVSTVVLSFVWKILDQLEGLDFQIPFVNYGCRLTIDASKTSLDSERELETA